MADEEGMVDYTCWIEVRLSPAEPWRRYDVVSSGSECRGVYEYDEWPFTPVELAQQELSYNVPEIICDQAGLKDFPVRARVWEGTDTEADPVVVLLATAADKAPGWLRAASAAVRKAEAQRTNAWCELREAAVRGLSAGMSEQTIMWRSKGLLDEAALSAAREASYVRRQVGVLARCALASGDQERVTVRLSEAGVAVTVSLSSPAGLDPDELSHEHDEGWRGELARERLASDQACARRFLESLAPRFQAVTESGEPAEPASMVPGAYQYAPVTVRPLAVPATAPRVALP
ncbi:hypothetical protein SUDANB96_00014 [Streptomyces sp. enrichment culture]